VSLVTSGMRVFVHRAAATPTPLLEALAARRDLEDVRLYHLHVDGPAPWTAPECSGCFRSVSFFNGPAMRAPVEDGRADFVPIFLSDVPGLFTSGRLPLDVAIVQLSPPDRHGYCSLGTSADAARAAIDSARLVVAEINKQMPRTHAGHRDQLCRRV
jgi:4-hydroxybutyrate CoA-transferase